MINHVIIVEWLLAILIGALFLVLYGSPRKYEDGHMSWHLAWTVFSGVLHYIGLLVATRTLLPIAVADGLAVGIIGWRLALLLATRRAQRRERDGETPD